MKLCFWPEKRLVFFGVGLVYNYAPRSSIVLKHSTIARSLLRFAARIFAMLILLARRCAPIVRSTLFATLISLRSIYCTPYLSLRSSYCAYSLRSYLLVHYSLRSLFTIGRTVYSIYRCALLSRTLYLLRSLCSLRIFTTFIFARSLRSLSARSLTMFASLYVLRSILAPYRCALLRSYLATLLRSLHSLRILAPLVNCSLTIRCAH
jgi:hypothetical protein